jgi:nitroimidazol reductase NimA-like FMN-containing flavoprotein (pyridoxamine 5'-phosphate oxidase superfamily)
MGRLTPFRIRELDAAETLAVLARNHVGRIAYALHHDVGIVPVHYIYEDGWIYGRTEPGEKIEATQVHWRVAFEVDEIDASKEGADGWRSVVVRGGLYLFGPDDSPDRLERREHAVAALRRLFPELLTPDDPMPERQLIFGIAAQETSGRALEAAG